MKSRAEIPFAFVLDYLERKDPQVRRMFGCFAIYLEEKLVLVLRKRQDHLRDNGVWLATRHEHHESLQRVFPSMRPVYLLGNKPSAWQNIPETADDFEESVVTACELVMKNDPRIGIIPKRKRSVRKR